MAVKYTVVPKKDPFKPESPPKYYPIAVSTDHTGLRALAERIALMSTYSIGDTIGMLELLLQVLPDELARGNIVELGELGAFYLTIRASGEDDPEKVGRDNIKEAKVHFKPGKSFRNVLNDIQFRKA